MQLSIVIVNYNVKHFLEQCLSSVRKAACGMDAEIVVIDNHSRDNSVEYLASKFPDVRFMVNTENTGFARGCNQGASISSGQYLLFLNPDTLIPENCFKDCIQFMESHQDAGALGVRMVDGSGRFLKESKRAFPSPVISLYKLTGLARLFPRSKRFAKYHLGHLQEDKNHEVDVLAGAFLMIRKKVFEQVGGFDETFFMYGEDVDISYRIQQSGHKNYYYSGTSIVHFKGESTRKGSMNYVRMFYNAMSIFVRKHYGGSKAGVFNFLIHIAIWLRAAMAAATRFIQRIGLPLIDAGLILLSFWLMKNIWSTYVKPDTEYSSQLLWIAFPAFTIVYLITAYYAGLYDRWYRRAGLVRSTLIATIVLLAAYALLPERFRFSRGILLFGALLAFILISLLRWMLIRGGILNSNRERTVHAGTLIVGSPSEYGAVKALMSESGLEEMILGRVSLNGETENSVGNIRELKKITHSLPLKEIIFCEGTLSFASIINEMQNCPAGISLKFHAKGSTSIVGSDSKDSAGVAVSVENGFNMSDPYNQRIKRLMDVLVAIIGIAGIFIHVFFIRRPGNFLLNCFRVLAGQRTWVAYATDAKNLPPIRRGILASNGTPVHSAQKLPAESLGVLDYWYARDYELTNDLKLIARQYRRLGE